MVTYHKLLENDFNLNPFRTPHLGQGVIRYTLFSPPTPKKKLQGQATLNQNNKWGHNIGLCKKCLPTESLL